MPNKETEFLGLQPKQLSSALGYLSACRCMGKTREEAESGLSESLAQYGFPPDARSRIAHLITGASYDGGIDSLFAETSPDAPKASYLDSDIDSAAHAISSLGLPDRRACLLMAALIAEYRANPHPSGWIRYQRKPIFHLAGLSGIPVREQEELTRLLHSSCGLDMQVVGSNNPMPCFALRWAKPTADGGPSPTIAGPLTPDSVAAMADRIMAAASSIAMSSGPQKGGKED